MNIHQNARTTPVSHTCSFAGLMRAGRRCRAEAAGISLRTAFKWLRHFARKDAAGFATVPLLHASGLTPCRRNS